MRIHRRILDGSGPLLGYVRPPAGRGDCGLQLPLLSRCGWRCYFSVGEVTLSTRGMTALSLICQSMRRASLSDATCRTNGNFGHGTTNRTKVTVFFSLVPYAILHSSAIVCPFVLWGPFRERVSCPHACIAIEVDAIQYVCEQEGLLSSGSMQSMM